MKQIYFAGCSLDDLKQFSGDAMRKAGYQLDKIQQGLQASDCKPMSSIGSGVREIRIRDSQGVFRVIQESR